MANDISLIFTDRDHERLLNLVAGSSHENAPGLLGELERGTIVPQKQVPADVVTMHSTVLFKDRENSHASEITIVFPADANTEERKVSVLAPIGAALIGLRVGQSIDWELPNGKIRNLTVERILFQPEAAGRFDL